MLDKLQRLYRGLADLEKLREQVTALGEQADRNGECICLSEVDIAAIGTRQNLEIRSLEALEARVETLEQEVTDVNTYKGRLFQEEQDSSAPRRHKEMAMDIQRTAELLSKSAAGQLDEV